MNSLNKIALRIPTIIIVGILVLIFISSLSSRFDIFGKNNETLLSPEIPSIEISSGSISQGQAQVKKLSENISHADILRESGIEVLKNPSIETGLPAVETFRLAGSNDNDITYWKQVLPEDDRNANKYIVIPSNGLIVPINEFEEDSESFNALINGREADINTPLETGALEYPGTSINDYGEEGNKMVFAHSSYWKGEEGRYKTHFQKIIGLEAGQEVWIYVKDTNGEYTQYKYVIEESYNTSEYDTSIFLPGEGKNLTLFTCTPIGGTSGRWIIKARYLDSHSKK